MNSLRQFHAISKPDQPSTERKLKEAVQSSTDPVIKFRGAKINAKWMREMMRYQVLPDLSFVPDRSLAIEGGRDIQVKPGSAVEFHEFTGANVKVFPDMNHILRRADRPNTMMNLKREYKGSLQEELHQGLLEELNNWFNDK